MKYPKLIRPVVLVSSLVAGLPALRAADLFVEDFDAEEEASIEVVKGAAMEVTFVDYSAMTVGATLHAIPEAPHRIPGSAPTKGVLLKTIYTDGGDPPVSTAFTDRLANLVALDGPLGSRLALTDNYRLKFDAYLRLSPTATPASSGTTEQLLWGVGYNATAPMGRNWRTGRGNGMWGWLTTEGGFGSTTGSDASLYQGPTLVGGRNLGLAADDELYFTPAFGADSLPIPNAPANQWIQGTITVLGKAVTVEYEAVGRAKTIFYQNSPGTVLVGDIETSFIGGTVMVGYEDSATSASFAPDEQWVLFDNMVVEDLTPPTLVVTQSTPLVTYTGTPQTVSWSVANGRTTGNLTLSAVSLAGANAGDFSVVTPLPLVIPPGTSSTLSLSFAPAAPNGLKTATATLVSDDPGTPSFPLGTLSARRSVPSFLLGHYKLDETSGTVLTDSSPEAINGTLQVREPVAFAQPSLLGAGNGTSLGFLPAQTGTTGNYFTAPVLHTPSFSISLWVKPSAAGTIRTLFQRDHNFATPLDKIYALLLSPEGVLTFRVGSTDMVVATTPAPDDVISHVVVTHLDADGFGNETAGRTRVYVNGVEAGTIEEPDAKGFLDYPLNPTITGLHVGSRTAAGYGFAGQMDDLQVYGEELTPAQVLGLFQSPGSVASNGPAVEAPAVLASALLENPLRYSLTVSSSTGFTYTLQRSTNLTNWTAVGSPVPGAAGGQITLEDPAPPAGQQFYRVLRN